MKKGIAVVGIAVGLVALAACDTATTSPNGQNWLITPDLAMHIAAGEPLLTGSGQCGNGVTTWIAHSGEVDAYTMVQGQVIAVSCYPGHTTGTWGLDDRPK